MSEFRNQDVPEPDFRTEPGIWLQKLVSGAWEIIWKTTGFIAIVVFAFYCMIHAIVWFNADDLKEQEDAYYRERTVMDFSGSALKPQLVTDETNFVEVTYAGESEPLTGARFSVTLTLRNGKELKIDQYRAIWKPQQKIQLEVPSSEPVEKLKLVGSAKQEGKNKILYSELLFIPQDLETPEGEVTNSDKREE